jgi:hypothetical protein
VGDVDVIWMLYICDMGVLWMCIGCDLCNIYPRKMKHAIQSNKYCNTLDVPNYLTIWPCRMFTDIFYNK